MPSRATWGSLLLVGLLLLMPMNYRAGTDLAHPHAFFQGILDTFSGTAHHHGDADVTTTSTSPATTASTALSPFTAAAIPLEAAAAASDHHETVTPDLRSAPDVVDAPAVTDQKAPAELGATIAALGMLLALVFTSHAIRRLWFATTSLTGIATPIDAPPPRIA